MVLLCFFAFLLFSNIYNSQTFCNRAFCLNTREEIEVITSVEFNIKTLTSNIGYAAFGLGSSMDK